MKTFTIAAALTAGILLSAQGAFAAPGTYQATTTSQIPLSANGGVATTVLSLTIPAGAWVARAKANPVNFGTLDYNRCAIYLGSNVLDGSAANTGDQSYRPAVTMIVNQGAVTTTSTQVFSLVCGHDYSVAGEYLDPGASLIVERSKGPISGD